MKKLIIIGVVLVMCLLAVSCAKTPPATQNKPEGKLIRDLAYMQAVAHQYSDDADPDPEGAEINLLWYDSKSELIFPSKHKHITLQVSIEIFACKPGEYPISYTECVYKDEQELSYPFEMRIPFEDINANPKTYRWAGKAKIVIHTPQQGDFPIEDITIPLFPYEKPPLKPPPTPAPLPSPTQKKPPTNIIQDLAYLKAGDSLVDIL